MTIEYSTPAFPQGVEANAEFMPVAGAYIAGAVVGAAKRFDLQFAASALDVPHGTLFNVRQAISKIALNAVPSGMTTFTLQMYSRAPALIADKAAWILSAADVPYYLGPLLLVAPALPAPGSAALTGRSAYDVFAALDPASPDLFGYLTTQGPFTATAVAVKVNLTGLAV